MSGEVTAHCKVEVVLEIVNELFLGECIVRFLRQWSLNVLIPMAYAPEIERDVLAKLANNDLDLWEAVENAVADDAEKVEGDTVGEAERRPTRY
jgi:hypothetical protein